MEIFVLSLLQSCLFHVQFELAGTNYKTFWLIVSFSFLSIPISHIKKLLEDFNVLIFSATTSKILGPKKSFLITTTYCVTESLSFEKVF